MILVRFSTLVLYGCERLVACEVLLMGICVGIGVGRVQAEAREMAMKKAGAR